MAEEKCKYCRESTEHLEIYEVCPCRIGKTQNKLKKERAKRLSKEDKKSKKRLDIL